MTASVASVELESFEYHRKSETYHAQYDQDTTSASMAVVATVANIMDVDPIELDPLHYTIDTDAVNELVRVQDTSNGAIRVSFTFEAYAITVSSDGTVALSPSGNERTDVRNEGRGR